MYPTVLDDENDKKEAEKERQSHLKTIAPKLEVVEKLIADENFNANSDEAFRVRLQQVKQTLLESNSDRGELNRLMKSVDDVLTERQLVKETGLLKQKAELQELMDHNAESLNLLGEPEVTLPQGITIDRSQSLGDQGDQLFNAVKDTPAMEKVFQANRDHDSGNSEPLEALIQEVSE